MGVAAMNDVAVEESAISADFDSAPMAVQTEEAEEDTGGMSLPEAGEALRTNFAETAFFYPQLHTNEQGEVVIAFTIPESLTRWSFVGYAHTKDMQVGTVEEKVTTSKDFMLRPNMPRFLRVGDETQIAATIQNVSEKEAKGEVRFILFNPVNEQVYRTQKARFSVNAGQTGSVKCSPNYGQF